MFDFDPEAEIHRRLRMPRIPGQKRKAAFPPLDPAEEKSLLSDVLSTGTSGLQYLGETLDKPGRAFRGLLAGKPKELANLIPFSDAMGLTDPAESVSGRDLLEQHAGLAKNKPGFADLPDALGDVAGFGVEVATDPLSYLLGPLAAGKYVAKAGKGAKAAFGLTTGPLGLLGVSGKYVPEIAKSATALKIAEAPGKALMAIPGMEALNRGRKALFDYRVKGQLSAAGQKLGEAQTAAQAVARPEAIKDWSKLAGSLEDIRNAYATTFGKDSIPIPENLPQTFEKVARATAEGMKPTHAFARHQLPYHGQTAEALQKAVSDWGATTDNLWNEFLDLGGNSAAMHQTESMKHAPRYMHPKGQEAIETHAYRGTVDSAKARVVPTKFLPETIISDVYRDPTVALMTKEAAKGGDVVPHLAQHLANEYGSFLKTAAESRHGEAITRTKAAADEAIAKFTQLQESLAANPGMKRKLGPQLRKADAAAKEAALTAAETLKGTAETPLQFGHDLAEHLISRNKAVQFFNKTGNELYGQFSHDAYKYGTELASSVGRMRATHETIKNSLVPGGVDLATLFKDAGMNPQTAMEGFAKRFGAVPQGMGVAPDVANAVLAMTKKSQKPEWLKATLDHVDGMTKWFKQNVTLPWPAFAARNLASGQWMNIASNEIPDIKHLGAYVQAVRDAHQMLKNPGSFRDLLEELAAHRVYDQTDIGALGTELGWSLKNTPNPLTPAGMLQNVKGGFAKAKEEGFGLGPGLLADTRVARSKPVKAAVTALATPAQIGGELNRQVEFMNRVPMYLYLRKKLGMGAEEAAAKVRQLQVSYDELAPFEKEVMKRLVPFYTWQRKIIPVMLQQVAERPGGVTAQTIRASNTGRSKDEFVPPYVGEGMSVNLGGDRYLSGLGLPTDQFADLFVKGPTALGTVKRTGQKFISQTNPLVKGPLETATGINTFTGRPVEESFQHPTKNVLLNQIIHNSPGARLATSERQLEDMKLFGGRKEPWVTALNLGTGLRISDTSGGMERQQRMAESKMLQELLREDPNIGSSTDVYVKKDQRTGLPLEIDEITRKRMQALMAIKKRAAEEAKRRKKRPIGAQ